MIGQYRDFMRDSWNHPSVVIWDASNETRWDFLGDKLIPAVRGLDLSGRPWENSYNKPQGATDPFEHHPYLFWRFTKEPLAEGETPHLDMRFVEQLDMSKRALGYKRGTRRSSTSTIGSGSTATARRPCCPGEYTRSCWGRTPPRGSAGSWSHISWGG